MDLAHAAELAFAMAPSPGQGGGGGWRDLLGMAPLFVGMFAIMYFVMIRPQQKQRREREAMLKTLKKGHRVVTTSGLHATITGLAEHTVTLRIADQVRVEYDRLSIGRVVETPGDKDA